MQKPRQQLVANQFPRRAPLTRRIRGGVDSLERGAKSVDESLVVRGIGLRRMDQRGRRTGCDAIPVNEFRHFFEESSIERDAAGRRSGQEAHRLRPRNEREGKRSRRSRVEQRTLNGPYLEFYHSPKRIRITSDAQAW